MYGSLKASRPIFQRFCSTSERGWVVVRNMSSCLYLPTYASLYQRILSAGEMLTTRRVKYAQYRVGIGKSDTPLKRWIYSLINPYTQHLKTPFLDGYIWIWMREKRHDIESAAFKGNLIFYLPCSTTRMARVRSSFRSSVTWWATRWTPPTIKKRWEMVSFEGSWFLGGLPIAV